MADQAVKDDRDGQRRQCRQPVKLVEHRELEEADWFHSNEVLAAERAKTAQHS